MSKAEGNLTAPDFPEGLEWLNTDRPVTLPALRGKVVLLNFWTACCINCMHNIPELKRLEAEYAEALVVVGVHSAKFDAEKKTENLRQAVLRHEIEHAVVNDRDRVIWRRYGVRAWPTLILIDPEARVVGTMSGEGAYDILGPRIQKVVRAFDREGRIDKKPFAVKPEGDSLPDTPLSFPGKVLADRRANRLFAADSNHNRILLISLPGGAVTDVIGSGRPGLADGSFEQAMFREPQGMAHNGPFLYVADRANHAIRRIDFEKRVVTTIAGTGEQTHDFQAGGRGKDIALTSPWDLALHENKLYIAMAGSRQVWRMDLQSGIAEPHAGSGREDLIDGPLPCAAFAKPSGITTDGDRLYCADSGVSAVRAADIDLQGSVSTLIGRGRLKFGDRDGTRQDALLQHPLGIDYHEGFLYVADTYNNKIKRIKLKERACETFLGTGENGFRDGPDPRFDGPGGVSAAAGKLFIADTNNHAIRIADIGTGYVETLEIRGLGNKTGADPPEN